MTSVIFDPDAKVEFLAAIQYYDDCQHGLGHRFRFVVESSIKKIAEAPFVPDIACSFQTFSFADISICDHVFH